MSVILVNGASSNSSPRRGRLASRSYCQRIRTHSEYEMVYLL